MSKKPKETRKIISLPELAFVCLLVVAALYLY